MKRRILAAALCSSMVIALTACGDPNKNVTASVDYQLDLDKLVGEICDYSSMNVPVENDYTVDQDSIDGAMESLASSVVHYVEVTDRTTVQDGDYVLVDYTGYQDGTAFDGGSATDQYVLVSEDNGYIDGFTDGLPGQEVGADITYDVTFPDDYSSTDLAGQTVQFEFVIHGIYTGEAATLDTLTDDDVLNNYYSTYGVSNVAELESYVTDYFNSQSEYYSNQEKQSSMQEYVAENSEVTVPEDYLNLRVKELLEKNLSDAVDDVTDQDAVDEYLSTNYGMSYQDLVDEMEQQIKVELVFTKIAEIEGITIDEDGYATYISNLVSNYGYDDETALYEAYGNEDAEKGETFLRKMYLISLVSEKLMDNTTTYLDTTASDDSTESADTTEAE